MVISHLRKVAQSIRTRGNIYKSFVERGREEGEEEEVERRDRGRRGRSQEMGWGGG